jgi:tetratricopeptide (TPR) repeat protein
MKLIELDTAAQQIKRACEGKKRPFVFIVGAGISYPPIPLAYEIEKHCRATASVWGPADEPAGMSPIDSYSYWFDRAYEQPILRQEYLRSLIEGRQISHANFRLAHLLLEKQISNIVITPNFDDFLSRALTLFGKPPIVCDHSKTVERINPEADDIQIVHVHGTYWFYDCCNLKHEIEDRAKSSELTNATMAFKLDDILSRRSPLVVGYSGWEGDVIMSALKRRLKSDLPYKLYWFCYKPEQVDSLPGWLKDHARVCLVIPQLGADPKTSAELSKQVGSGEAGKSSSPKAEASGYSDKKGQEPALTARDVLDKLIQTFDLHAPELTSDPLSFFADYLHSSLPQDETEKATDVYSFGSVIERIRRAKQNEAIQANEQQLEQVRDALRRSKYREAIQQGNEISRGDLDTVQVKELIAAILEAAVGLNDNSTEELDGYDLVVRLSDGLSDRGVEDPSLGSWVARALFNKGCTLDALNRSEEEIVVYDEVIKRFRDAAEPDLREQVANALINKGLTLGALNRSEEEIALYDEVMKRFGEATEPSLRELVAKALYNKAVTLGALNRSEEEIALYDEVMKRFGEATEPSLRELVAKALYNKAVTLGALNRSEEENVEFDEVVRRFGDATEPALRELVAKALVSKGFRLGAIKQSEEAIALYDEVIKRFGDASEPALREQVATALTNKGLTLGALNRSEEEIALYDEVVKRFGEATEPSLREQVGISLNARGFRLLCNAKQAWLGGDEIKSRALLMRAQETINTTLEYDADNATVLGNKAYIAFLLGNEDKARDILTKAISLGGKELQQAELEDSKIHPLPQDERFRELVLSVPLPENDTISVRKD